MRIRTLRRADVPEALGLSEQAGWNQIAADWHRLLELAPDGCFVGVVDGEVVATSTLVTYDGTAGWIGMVLVDEDHRGRGFGTRIFERALDVATDRGLAEIGLDATDAGRDVYRKSGFVDVEPIERWGGTLDAVATARDRAVVRDPPPAHVLPIDRQACGLDRGALLNRLTGEDGVETLLTTNAETNEPEGYAVVRPGREARQLGPVVAADGDALTALLAAAEDATGGQDVILDVLGSPDAKTVLRDVGLERQRRLARMTYREPIRTLTGEDVVAAAGFELG